MKVRAHQIIACAIIGLIAITAAQPQQPKTFPSPDDAAKALVEAAAQPGLQALLEVFGAGSKDLFLAGEHGEALRKAFVEAAAKKVSVDTDNTNLGRGIIEVGENGWPFPVPVVSKDGEWQFDIDEGRREIAARRLGANELAAISACLGYIEAQQEYASVDRNNDGMLEYAQRILSTPGKKDGLYWDGTDSPVAGVITKAIADGHQPGKEPFRGYYFRTLRAQGPDAEGGAMNYVVNNKWMIGGYALLAWPAEYGVSGVRTFIVSHHGVIYEKDLGMSTATAAAAIKRFNPDRSWSVVMDAEASEE